MRRSRCNVRYRERSAATRSVLDHPLDGCYLPRVRTLFVLSGLAIVTACASESQSGLEPPKATPTRDAGSVDAATFPSDASDAGADAGLVRGPPPSTLPVTFTRPDVGTPLTAAELAKATDELVALLKGTSYFQFVDDRVHGWPETDPGKGYWYGHYWSGVRVTKAGGTVTYTHSTDGADNVGISTAPYLEGACYGYLMWGDAKLAHLTRRMLRAYSAWVKAMVRSAGDTNPTLLARNLYHHNVTSTEGGRSLAIDYSPSFPGIDADPSEYVHVPTNPTFGDVYIKNKRSKDDIGHMLRSMALLAPCGGRLDAAGKADMAELKALYESWGKRVNDQGFAIETLDKSQNLWTPPDQLAHYTLIGNVECLGALSLRLKGTGVAGDLDCGTGLGSTEKLAWNFLKNDARQIVRTHHAAALTLAYEKAQLPLARLLLQGLSERVELDLGVVEGGSPPAGFSLPDVTSELVYAGNAGVPLTSREVRWLHGRVHDAFTTMLAPANARTFRLFDAATPDGTYSYDPPESSINFRDLGMLIGTCASTYRNPAGRAVLDCDKLLAAF